MHCTFVWASKGGSGKTTTVANIGAALAVRGYNVLLVGLDPNGDLSRLFGVAPDDQKTVRVQDLIEHPALDPRQAAISLPLIRGAQGKLRLLASSRPLELRYPELVQRGFTDVRRILDCFEGDADIALLDMASDHGPLHISAARATDSMLLPVPPGDFERDGVHRAITQSQADTGYPIPTLGVLFIATADRAKVLRRHRQAFEEEGIHVLAHHTRPAISVRDDPSRGGPSVLTQKRDGLAKDYKAIAGEVLDRIIELGDAGAAR